MKTILVEMNFIEKENKYLNLKGHSIQNATYQNAIFSGSLFQSCLFENVTFSGCTFYACNFNASDFKNCTFVDCNFSFSNINDCNFLHTAIKNSHHLVQKSAFNLFFNCQLDNQSIDTFYTDDNEIKSCFITDDNMSFAA